MRDITHIVMTAGGTSEPIDGVRRISNCSTGTLCACIYEALSDYIGTHAEKLKQASGEAPDFMVHYVLSSTAVRPAVRENLPISFYPVRDVASVMAMLETLMTRYKVGYVIHGMAVSDFTKGYLAERDALADELAAAVEKTLENGRLDPSALRKTVAKILRHPRCAMDAKTKVSSRSELILSLVKTPKIIAKIKQWDPSTCLVGFKLLKGVSEEELIRVASELAEANGCAMVLANDAEKIGPGRHFGLLIRDGGVIGRYETKQEIAAGIADRLMSGYTGV